MTNERYHYRECGLPNIYLANGVIRTETPWGEAIAISEADALHHTIAMRIIHNPNPMTKEEFRFLRIELDLRQRTLAGILGATEKNVQRWESGDVRAIPGPAQRALKAFYVAKTSDEDVGEMMTLLAELDRDTLEAERKLFELQENEWLAA